MFKPFRIRDLQKWFGNRGLSSMCEYGRDHSSYPYYIAFMDSDDVEELRRCHTGSVLTARQAKRINRECGFQKSHKKNLWYCPICVREDIAIRGETCWRRLPQMPGTMYCPVHKEKYRESGVSFQQINYQIMPATYALMHYPEHEQENGTVYREQYIGLSRNIAWLLDNGFMVGYSRWIAEGYLLITGKSVNEHLLYGIPHAHSARGQFEDYLSARIMKDMGKDVIDESVNRQISTIIAVMKVFGSVEKLSLLLYNQ